MVETRVIDGILGAYQNDAVNLLQILLKVQSVEPKNYVSEEVAMYVANHLDIPISRVYEVVTYFAALSHKPQGKHVIQICNTTVCQLNGFNEVLQWFKDALKINPGETTADGLFSMKLTPCIGACDISPAIKIGTNVYGNLTKEKVEDILSELRGAIS